MNNLCPLVEHSRVCVAAILNSRRQAWGLGEGSGFFFQDIKIILWHTRVWIYYFKKVPRNWRGSFLKQTLSPSICLQANIQCVFFSPTHVSTCFQWHAHQRRRRWHYYGSLFLVCGDSWVTPVPVFCKMKLCFCTVAPEFWRNLIDTHTCARARTHTRTLQKRRPTVGRERHHTQNVHGNTESYIYGDVLLDW